MSKINTLLKKMGWGVQKDVPKTVHQMCLKINILITSCHAQMIIMTILASRTEEKATSTTSTTTTT